MRIKVEARSVGRDDCALVVLPVFKAGPLRAADLLATGNTGYESQLQAALDMGDFTGKADETLLFYPVRPGAKPQRVLLVGLGEPASLTAERLRRLGGIASKQAGRMKVERLAVQLPESDRLPARDRAQAITEGLVLGAYAFREFKTGDGEESAARQAEEAVLGCGEESLIEASEGARFGEVVARAERLARDLGNLPPNVVTPAYLAETAERIARERGMRATILGRRELEEEGMRALLAVSQGSDQEPRLIVLEHRGGAEDQKPLVIVGKGVTFDAGGISIKPAANMEEMKFDMSGAGATLAAMQAVAELGLPANVVGIVPATENLLSGSAMRPGDILRTHLGKTVEIVNTDAEGRLILADALSYARRFEPAAVVDAATLTGACVVALGHVAAAMYGNDEALAAEVRAAGERVGSRVWPMPMFDEYRDLIRSEYADIKNSGGRPAGSITAAWFLREFAGSFPWVHLDVAGTAFGEGKLPYQTRGSTGVPTRLFVEWVRARSAG
jgi:leucyl aminopeptidase